MSAPCTVLISQDFAVNPLWGIIGGRDGRRPETWLVQAGKVVVS